MMKKNENQVQIPQSRTQLNYIKLNCNTLKSNQNKTKPMKFPNKLED